MRRMIDEAPSRQLKGRPLAEFKRSVAEMVLLDGFTVDAVSERVGRHRATIKRYVAEYRAEKEGFAAHLTPAQRAAQTELALQDLDEAEKTLEETEPSANKARAQVQLSRLRFQIAGADNSQRAAESTRHVVTQATIVMASKPVDWKPPQEAIDAGIIAPTAIEAGAEIVGVDDGDEDDAEPESIALIEGDST